MFTRTRGEINQGRTKYCSMYCYTKHRTKKNQLRVKSILKLGKKQCQFCKKTLTLEQFFKNKKTRDGFGSYCKNCKQQKNNKSWTKNRYKHLEERKNNHLLKTYNISLKDYKEMLNNQYGLCAICFSKDKRKLAVDHNHKTGKIRGLLCQRCNQGIGMFQDNYELLINAIKYIKK
jgi:hypothetical protein